MDSNALLIIVMIFIAVALSIGSFVLAKKQRKNRASDISRQYTGRASRRKNISLKEMYPYLIGYAANKLSTENKTDEMVYTPEGHLRDDIKTDIAEKRLEIQDFLTTYQPEFEKRLKAGRFVDASGKLPPENVNLAADELYVFYKERT